MVAESGDGQTINLAQLRAFYQVARLGGFSRAADVLHLTQPAVSRQVQALERSLGVRLLAERGRPVELSDAGRVLYQYAEDILSLCGEATRTIEELRTLERGRVRLAASTTPAGYLLSPVLAQFGRRHPGIDVEVAVACSAEVARLVSAGEVDLAVLADAPAGRRFFLQPLTEDEVVLTCPVGHRLAGRTASPADLVQETLLLREPGSGTRAAVETFLAAAAVSPTRIITLGSTEAIKQAVAAGMGVAFLSRLTVAAELAAGSLVAAGLSVRRTFYLAARKDQHLSPASLALRAFLQKTIGGQEKYAAATWTHGQSGIGRIPDGDLGCN